MKESDMIGDCLKMLDGSIRIIKLANVYKNYIARYYPKAHDKAIKSLGYLKCKKGRN